MNEAETPSGRWAMRPRISRQRRTSRTIRSASSLCGSPGAIALDISLAAMAMVPSGVPSSCAAVAVMRRRGLAQQIGQTQADERGRDALWALGDAAEDFPATAHLAHDQVGVVLMRLARGDRLGHLLGGHGDGAERRAELVRRRRGDAAPRPRAANRPDPSG